MANDLISLAMERAVKAFGDKGDGIFNGAGFGKALADLAGAKGSVDGLIVRAMLTGRDDVEILRGSHYRLSQRGGEVARG